MSIDEYNVRNYSNWTDKSEHDQIIDDQRDYITNELHDNLDNNQYEEPLNLRDLSVVSDQPEYGGASPEEFKPDLIPSKEYIDIKSINNDDITEEDMLTYLYSIIDYQGLVTHNITAYDEFLERGITEIVQRLYNIDRAFLNKRDQTEKDRKIKTIRLNIEFYDVSCGYPTHGQFKGGDTQPLFPKEARSTDIPYSAPVTMNANIKLTAINFNGQEESATINIGQFSPCHIPIMTGSVRCHLRNLTRNGMKFYGEDPNEPGGIFILRGQEYIIDPNEASRFNKLQCYILNQNGEIVRGNYLSQPPNERFGNSSQVKISLMTNTNIMIEINSIKFLNVKIPFYLIYRLLGMTDATEMIKTIIFDLESTSPEDIKMMQILYDAYHAPDKRFGHLQYMSDRMAFIEGMAMEMTKSMTNRMQVDTAQKIYVNQDLLHNMDQVFLPHVGKTPNTRITKLRVLGTMIREILLTHLGLIQPSDRDSLGNKRMQGGGTSMPKLFKTMFNSYIITPFIGVVKKEIISSPWEQIKNNMSKIKDLFDNIVHNAELTRGLEQGITSSSKTINNKSSRKDLANRVVSKILERKNFLFYVAALRAITRHSSGNASKQTKRADEIRRVHATMPGYICPLNSPDSGEPVGTRNNLAITATIIGAGNSYNLKLKLLADPEIIPLADVKSEDISRQKLATVYVNGEWIGCCQYGHQLVSRYRKLRREHKAIDRFTTITWDTQSDKVDFLLDADRVIRPLLIIDSNKEEYDESIRNGKPIEFVQNIRLTKDHINKLKFGDITFEDIIEDGIVEYVSPEEQENCYICPCFSDLLANKNNYINQFTHLEVPAAILGITGHMTVLANNTQPARGTYQTNQSKQTAGWYVTNFDDRVDKLRTFQYYNEFPLCKTIAARYIPPNGCNIYVGYLAVGENMEDSSIYDKASIERGLYSASYFKKESHELDQDEEFGNVDPAKTQGVKKNGNYNKLVDGVVPVGTIITKGDIIIGVMMKNSKRGSAKESVKFEYIDKSIMYKSAESCVVSKVIQGRGQNHERFITVVLRYTRHMEVGDKACLDDSHDVLTTDGWINIKDITTKHQVATLNEKQEIEYHHPNETYSFDHNGELYEIENTLISQCVTTNHRMYVSKRTSKDGKEHFSPYALEEAKNIFGKICKYKTNGINTYPDIEYHEFSNWKIPMDLWLQFLGIWIADGHADYKRGIVISVGKQRKINFIMNILDTIGIEYKIYDIKKINENFMNMKSFIISDIDWKNEIIPLNVGTLNKFLPEYVWKLSQNQCKILLNSLIEGDGNRNGNVEKYYTSSLKLADDIQKLCLHAGYSGTIHKRNNTSNITKADAYYIGIIKQKCNPKVNYHRAKIGKTAQIEHYVHYTGKVYCVNVTNHIFYIRRNGKCSWTGNSSRSGNKMIVASLFSESDMPYTENGIPMDLLMNPHSQPSRMTIGQLMESQINIICARKGVTTDITSFRTIDKDNLVESCVKIGMRYNGKSRAFDGVTGRYYNISIFAVPVYIQKLQKYVMDNKYSVSRTCPTDATTGQPLSGKASGGGIRIGEMESITLETHGVLATTFEKFSMDSDGFKTYICRRCGYQAIYNDQLEIYKCNMCGDHADISIVETSRSSTVFLQELAGSNIKVRRGLAPREFEVFE